MVLDKGIRGLYDRHLANSMPPSRHRLVAFYRLLAVCFWGGSIFLASYHRFFSRENLDLTHGKMIYRRSFGFKNVILTHDNAPLLIPHAKAPM